MNKFGKNEKNLISLNKKVPINKKENSNYPKKPAQYSDKLFLSIKKNFKDIENVAAAKDKFLFTNETENKEVKDNNNDSMNLENSKNLMELSNYYLNDSKHNLINFNASSSKSDLFSLLNESNEKKSESEKINRTGDNKLSNSSDKSKFYSLNKIFQNTQKINDLEKNISLSIIDSEQKIFKEDRAGSSKFSNLKLNENDIKQIKISSKFKDIRNLSTNDLTNYKSKSKSNSSLIFNDISYSKIIESKPLISKPKASSKFTKKKSFNPNRNLYKIDKINESDSEDGKEINEYYHKFLIMPYNGYKKLFDFIMALIFLYSAIIIPYKLSFIDCDGEYDDIIEYFIKSCLFIDIILNFFTAYIDIDNKLITNRNKIIIKYLKTWFTIDLISILPIWIPVDNSSCNDDIKRSGDYYSPEFYTKSYHFLNTYLYFRSMQLLRLLKMLNKKRNVSSLAKYIGEKLKITRNIEKLFYFTLLFLLFNHLSACIWFYIARFQNKSPESWVNRLNYVDASNFELYMISFYWTLTIVTTVGYGDINAGTEIERIYSLFVMCFGVLMYSFAIGSMSAILESINSKGLELNQKLQILASIKKEFDLKSDIYHKVCKVIKHDQNRNLRDKIIFLHNLPNKLKIELSKILYDDVIYKLYFFREQPAEFISYVVPLLKPIKFSKRDYLYKIDDTIDEIYLIAKGTISFCLDEVYLETEIKEVKKYNNFGEIEMCLNEKLDYNIKVKSRNCELFVLKKNNFLSLSVNYKGFFDYFMRHSLLLYSRFNSKKKKIIKILEEENTLVQENLKKRNKKIEEENENFEYITSEEREEDSSELNEELLNFENSSKNSKLSKEEKKENEDSYNSSSESSDSKSSLKSNSKFSNEKSKSSENSGNSEKSSNYSKKNKSDQHKKSLNLLGFPNNYTVMDLLQPEREKTKNLSPKKNKFRKAKSETIEEKFEKLPNSNNISKNNSNTSIHRLNKGSKEKPSSNKCLNKSINNSAQNLSNSTNNLYKYLNKNNSFTGNFKLGANSNFNRRSIAETSLNVFKRFQLGNNEEEAEEHSAIPMIRNQIRKNTSMSYKNDSDENDENFSLENENNKFLNIIDKIIDFLEKNRQAFIKKFPNKLDNPVSLLIQLKSSQNLSERNEIIEKIESIADKFAQMQI